MRTALLVVTLLSGCASREEGIEVEVSLRFTVPPGPVQRGRLSLSRARLVPCTEVLAAWSPVSSAWAHGEHVSSKSSPFEAALAVDADVLSPTPVLLATFTPPPTLVCGVELDVAPSATEAAWKGTSLWLEATANGATRSYFSMSGKRHQARMMPFELTSTQRRRALTIHLDGAAFTTLQPAMNDARRELLDSLLASMTITDDTT